MLISSKAFFNEWWPKLVPLYPQSEAKSLVGWLLEDLFAITKTDVLLDKPIDAKNWKKLEKAIEQISGGVPIQHVLGYAWFMNQKFQISSDVLIPRQETEELVHLVIKENPGFSGSILDIGTGSGIIPISLKLALPMAHLTGLDLSVHALEIANKNATSLNAKVDWLKKDILTDRPAGNFDIIISNPPYILESEKKDMHPNVVGKDPDLALFVADNDPLLFYKRIIHLCSEILIPEGKLYFEINERFGSEIADLLEKGGFIKVKVSQDLNGKDRMVSGIKIE